MLENWRGGGGDEKEYCPYKLKKLEEKRRLGFCCRRRKGGGGLELSFSLGGKK